MVKKDCYVVQVSACDVDDVRTLVEVVVVVI